MLSTQHSRTNGRECLRFDGEWNLYNPTGKIEDLPNQVIAKKSLTKISFLLEKFVFDLIPLILADCRVRDADLLFAIRTSVDVLKYACE